MPSEVFCPRDLVVADVMVGALVATQRILKAGSDE